MWRDGVDDLLLGDSPFGKGVFAGRDFDAGERIIQFVGSTLQRSDLPEIVEPEDDRYMQIGPDAYMGPSGGFDDFFNHSCDPNAGIMVEPDGVWLVALRAIRAGDEVAWDYSTMLDEDDWEMDCGCGSPNCRGRVRDFKYLEPDLQQRYIGMGIVPDFILSHVMTPKQAAAALRRLAEADDVLAGLERLALSIDGPSQKKDKGRGGKSPPTVTLLDVEMTDAGGVKQSWGVYANGQKVGIYSVTDDKGDTKIAGNDLDLGVDGLTAQQAVAFILHGAHPRYYPKPGKTVTLDEGFIERAMRAFG